MDALELSYPVDVAVPSKLAGSDEIEGGGIKENGVSASSLVAVGEGSSIEPFAGPIERKGLTIVKDTVEICLQHRLLGSPKFSQVCLPKNQNEPASNQLNPRCGGFLSPGLHGELRELHKKTAKMSRCSSGSAKRQKVTISEDVRSPEMNGLTDMCYKKSLFYAKCSAGDKAQTMKQKSNISGRRGDKRNPRALARTMANYSAATGENNFFGLFGLKPDINDVTKLVDDIDLNEILDGTYRCLPLGQVKGKRADSTNEGFLSSVRKACSVLPIAKPVQPHDSFENGHKGGFSIPDTFAGDKLCDSKCETPASLLDFPLCEPKNVLERIALPPPRDLESLLQDASKPSLNMRNSFDQRSGKHLSRRVNLSSFPWSNAFNWHAKANSDAVKLLTSRTPCQGHWAIIRNPSEPSANVNSFTNLDSFTIDQNIVPRLRMPGTIAQEFPSSFCGSLSCCKCSANPATHDKIPCMVTGNRVGLKDLENDWQCPKLLAAAQTLCGMATKFSRQNLNGVVRWPKKVSQKGMKACKTKANEKSKETAISSLSFALQSENHPFRGNDEQITPTKRPKYSQDNSKISFNHIEPRKNGLNSWHSSRSEKSSASVQDRDSVNEGKHLYMNSAKQACLTKRPFRVSDKVSSSKKKMRKLMAADWNEEMEK